MSQRRQFVPTSGALIDNIKTPFSDPAFQNTPALVSASNDMNNGARLNLGGIKKNSRLPRDPDRAAPRSPSRPPSQASSMNSHAARASLPKTFASDAIQSEPVSSSPSDLFPASLIPPVFQTPHFRPPSTVVPENRLGPNMSNSVKFSFSHVPVHSTMSPEVQMRSPADHSLILGNEDEYTQGIGERHSPADSVDNEQHERSGGKRSRATRDMKQHRDIEDPVPTNGFKRLKPDNSYNNDDVVEIASRTRSTHRQACHDDPNQTTAHAALLPDMKFSTHGDRVGDLRQKWNACTLEEWQQVGNGTKTTLGSCGLQVLKPSTTIIDITKKFNELVEFVQEYMRAKVGKYSELHIRTDVRNKRVLDFRDEKLKQARETLVSQTGALVGHSK